MNKVRISILLFTFLLGFIYQPNWVYNNFWFKADFYDSIPFTVPYWSFLLIYSILSTVLVEVLIRLVYLNKKM
jgi:quinol-cytochrome oxidoreductase complex cytochrome b subunit